MKRLATLKNSDFWRFVGVMVLISLGSIGLVVLLWWLVIGAVD